MTVKDLIKTLQENFSEDTEVSVGLWFEDNDLGKDDYWITDPFIFRDPKRGDCILGTNDISQVEKSFELIYKE